MFDHAPLLIPDVVAVHSRTRGAQPALLDGAQSLSWAEVDQAVTQVATALINAGLHKGECVALLTSNSVAAVTALFGVLRAGGVLVPLPGLLGPEALAAMVKDSGAKLLLADAATRTLAQQAAVVAKLPAGALLGLDFNADGWTAIGRLAGRGPAALPEVVEADPFNIIYSSGTTGTPKGIVHDHRARTLGALCLGLAFRMDCTVRTILATPLYTNGTWMTLLPTVMTGGRAMVLPKFSAEAFLDAVENGGGTHAFLVPTQIRAVLDALGARRRNLSSLRMVISAGSPIPRGWKDEAMAAFSGRLMELYGLTEGIGTVLAPEDMARKPDSVGIPITSTEIRIIAEDGGELPPGEIGEIVGYGAGMMRGYHNRPEATVAAIWKDQRGRRFLRTGDVGRLDQDGFVYVLDRKKDMIISGGVNVFAVDIERVVHAHPAVRDVAVIGVPHPKWVETPVAVVIAQPGADAEAIRAWANAALGRHQQLHCVVLRNADFPRNALGKVLKRLLREEWDAASRNRGGIEQA